MKVSSSRCEQVPALHSYCTYSTVHSPPLDFLYFFLLSIFLDSHSNKDLTSRLAQTNERMKKLSATLEPSLMTPEEWPEEEEVVVVSGRQQTSAHPLVRTTRIRVVDPLEGMIESMIHKPEDISPSSSDPCASSEGVVSPVTDDFTPIPTWTKPE